MRAGAAPASSTSRATASHSGSDVAGGHSRKTCRPADATPGNACTARAHPAARAPALMMPALIFDSGL